MASSTSTTVVMAAPRRPTEEHNVADAIAAYDHLVERGVSPEQIVLYGKSWARARAVRLAAAKPVATIPESPLTSTVGCGPEPYFWLPLRLLITDQYDNERNIHSVTAPVLVLHGEQDEVIPVEMGRRVYRAANDAEEDRVVSARRSCRFVRPWRVGENARLSGLA